MAIAVSPPSAPLVPAVFAAVLPESKTERGHHGADPDDEKHEEEDKHQRTARRWAGVGRSRDQDDQQGQSGKPNTHRLDAFVPPDIAAVAARTGHILRGFD